VPISIQKIRLKLSEGPWGLGPRVPLYVISPWSRGGWVNSQVFDHTSIGQFIEKRFGITIPAISDWHRAVCGDLTSTFDFVNPNRQIFPRMPHVDHAAARVARNRSLPPPRAPVNSETLFQEPGHRGSRALPYELNVASKMQEDSKAIVLDFINTGQAGVVFHVYDKRSLEKIPRRYTVEAGKSISDEWGLSQDAECHLWVYGPNGFICEFEGTASSLHAVDLSYDTSNQSLLFTLRNSNSKKSIFTLKPNAYLNNDFRSYEVEGGGGQATCPWSLKTTYNWYDVTIAVDNFKRRFAGRLETGLPSISDPLND
jgi:phospholipase C